MSTGEISSEFLIANAMSTYDRCTIAICFQEFHNKIYMNIVLIHKEPPPIFDGFIMEYFSRFCYPHFRI